MEEIKLSGNNNSIFVINNKLDFIKSIIYIFSEHKELIYSIIKKLDIEELSSLNNKLAEIIQEINKTDIKIFCNIIGKIYKKTNSAITIGIENNYIDRVYRDSYYMHFSQKHQEVSRYCKRLIFFKGIQSDNILNLCKEELQDNIIGSMVIRPLKNKSIGRTLINPQYFYRNKKEAYIRITNYKINYLGIELQIEAFPYFTQDSATTTCAEVSLLNVLDYYSNHYSDYKFLTPSDINKIVKINNFDRTLPTTGLSYETISKILCESGFSPKFYFKNKNIKENNVIKFISYYIESGIPVCIGLNPINKETNNKILTIGHSVICIGHGSCDFDLKHTKYEIDNVISTTYTYTSFIIQDDNNIPYAEYKIEEEKLIYNNVNYKIDCFVVPLYKRMYMDAQKAENTVLSILNNKKEFLNIDSNDNSTIIYRLFLASSRHFKSHRIHKVEKHSDIQKIYMETPLPQFIWICELYNSQGFKNNDIIGEIIIDATYSGLNLLDSILMISYKNRYIARNNSSQSIFEGLKPLDPFISKNTFKCARYNLNLNNYNSSTDI